MKIIYCINSIHYLGGIQRVTIIKANALAEIEGNSVYIAVSDNKEGVMVEPLSPKVHLIDLDVNYYADDWQSKWKVLKGIFIKRREHKKKLAKVLKEIQPDIVISVGQHEKNIIPTLKGPWKTIREFHFDRQYRTRDAVTAFQKLSALVGDFIDHFTLRKYDRIVVLTQEDLETNWKGWKNVITIPNPLTVIPQSISALTNKKIVTFGRLAPQKNYQSLIRAFSIVAMKHPDWTLEIWGEGSERTSLSQEIKELNLSDQVFLKGYTNNVGKVLQDSSIFAFTSIFEGFGLAILEAMSYGLPCVSYACPCGPKDIITDGKYGFLVDVNDEESFANKLCLLVENPNIRIEMGKSAQKRSEDYSLPSIIDKWEELFKELITI